MNELEFEALNVLESWDEFAGNCYEAAYGQATWVSCLLTDKPDIGCYPVMPQ